MDISSGELKIVIGKLLDEDSSKKFSSIVDICLFLWEIVDKIMEGVNDKNMSLDLNFNKSLSTQEIIEKTSIKVEEKHGSEFLVDQYGNAVFFKGYGITVRGSNPTKILDELIQAFDIMFLDDDAEDKLHYEPEKYKEEDVYWETMDSYGYVIDGVIQVPERDDSKYLPFPKIELSSSNNDDDDDLPF